MPFLKMHAGLLYREFIREMVARRAARGYLEVGVRSGKTLSLIDRPRIGVDP